MSVLSHGPDLPARFDSTIYSNTDFWHAHAFIFLLDAAAPARFPEAKEELLRLLDGIHYSYPVLVLANKIDLPSAVELRTIEDALSVPELVRGGKIALKVGSSLASCQREV